jgi:hypothetical protein
LPLRGSRARRVDVPLGHEDLRRDGVGEPSELGPEDAILIHRRDVAADELQEFLEGGGGARPVTCSACEAMTASMASEASRQRPAWASLVQARNAGVATSSCPLPPSLLGMNVRCAAPLGLLDVAVRGHGHVADVAVPVALSRLASHQQEIGQLRHLTVQKPRAVPVAEQTDIRPDAREIVERRGGHGVVVAARADAAPEWVARIGRQVHRIVGDRGERDRAPPAPPPDTARCA